MKIKVVTFFLTLIFAYTLFAEEPIEIDIPIFEGGYGVKFYQDVARAFEREHPGVKINLYGDPRMQDQVRIRVIEGNYPNATASDLSWYNLIKAGKILDLAPYLEGPNWENDARWRDTFLPGALEHWQEGEHVWAVPFAYATKLILYNKTLFRDNGWEIPQTWDELFSLCDQVQAVNIAPFAFPGVYMGYGDMFLRAAYYNLAGPDLYRRYNLLEKGTRSDPQFKKAAGILQRISTQYFQDGWEGMSHIGSQLQFFQGNTAMIAHGSWIVSEMAGKIPEDFELGAFRMPVFPEGKGSKNAVDAGSDYFFLFKEVENNDVTVEFFRFLTSRRWAKAFTERQDSPTAIMGTPLESYSPLMYDMARIIENSTDAYGSPLGSSPPYPGMAQAEEDARAMLMYGEISPEAFGDFLEASAEKERIIKINPQRVVYRHTTAGSFLIFIIVAAFVYTVYSQLKARKKIKPVSYTPGKLNAHYVLLFIGPAMVMYLVFSIKPSLESFVWAFTRWDGITDREYVGLLHFKRLLFESDIFWKALKNNLFVMFVPALFVIPIALFISFLISRRIWGSNMFRICFFFPNIMGAIAITILWMNAYDPQGGLINGALVGLGFTQFENYPWLSQEHLYWSLIPMAIWGACGFNMILYLAAMENVDTALYDAASIDGASTWQQFIFITIPQIWEALTISAVFMVIGGLKAFENIWLLTSQQPTSNTHVISTYMVTTMFKEFKVGQATAIAVLLFVLVFFGAIVTIRLMKRETVEVYQ